MMATKKHPGLTASFRETLRTSGLKATISRLAVLTVLQDAKRPMSAQAVIDRLKTMDQATVYRTLKSLKAKGIVKPIDLRHNHAHYELTNLKEHHHLICIQCGRVEDVHRCGVDDMQGTILRNAKHFAEIKQHTLEFYGVCKACAKTA